MESFVFALICIVVVGKLFLACTYLFQAFTGR